MGYQFYRATSNYLMAGNGREFDTIEELKSYVRDAVERCSIGFDANFDAPGYRWEIELSMQNSRGRWDFMVVETGIGKPPWIDLFAAPRTTHPRHTRTGRFAVARRG